uniref:Cytochrome c oxidase copper chaperone COX17 n=1 Tax=Otolemur garnettii TaxID=30611 RepID=H0WR73_OTOGA
MPSVAAASTAPSESQEKKPLKPCCACPETKKARDAWSRGTVSEDLARPKIPLQSFEGNQKLKVNQSYLQYIIEKGEEHCGHLIEAHKECMRALGFKI